MSYKLNEINKMMDIHMETEILLQFIFFHVENTYVDISLSMFASNTELVVSWFSILQICHTYTRMVKVTDDVCHTDKDVQTFMVNA